MGASEAQVATKPEAEVKKALHHELLINIVLLKHLATTAKPQKGVIERVAKFKAQIAPLSAEELAQLDLSSERALVDGSLRRAVHDAFRKPIADSSSDDSANPNTFDYLSAAVATIDMILANPGDEHLADAVQALADDLRTLSFSGEFGVSTGGQH